MIEKKNCYIKIFSSTFILAFNLWEIVLQYVYTELEQSFCCSKYLKRACPPLTFKLITFTFVSQFSADLEIKFLILDRNCYLTLIFQKEIRFPENQIFR